MDTPREYKADSGKHPRLGAAGRLAVFGAGIAAAFAVASVAGAALDVGGGIEEPAGEHSEDGMAAPHAEGGGDHATEAPAAPAGLAVADGGARLVIDEAPLEPGVPGTLAFRVVDDEGRTMRDFEVEHERRMHLIVVRRDLTGFQHLHPEQGADGGWSTELRLAEAGNYRVYADFALPGRSLTLAGDVSVPGDFHAHELPPERRVAGAGDGYRVELAETDGGATRFSISRDGEPVGRVQPYLGADGHLVVLRDGDGAFLHAHPLGEAGGAGPVEFEVQYPSAGRYRLYLQFKHDGEVRTAEFTKELGALRGGPPAEHGGHSHG